MTQTFSRTNLPSSPKTWPTYHKKKITSATRIDGPFTVETSEGPLHREDGYLAIDARGYPYPIAAQEFELIYEPLEPIDFVNLHVSVVDNDGKRVALDGAIEEIM